jgi:hypothetical protein
MIILVLPGIAGCLATDADREEMDGAGMALPVAEPSWEALGILRYIQVAPLPEVGRLLALSSSDMARLDAIRRGPDGLEGTLDDGGFTGLADLVKAFGLRPSSLQVLLKVADAEGMIVRHPIPPGLVGSVLVAGGPATGCGTYSWTSGTDGTVTSGKDEDLAPSIAYRLGYAGNVLTAEVLQDHLPGPAWVDELARRPGRIVVPFSETTPGLLSWDAGIWGRENDYLEVDFSLDASGIHTYFEVQCSGSETCPAGGSETYCNALTRVDGNR